MDLVGNYSGVSDHLSSSRQLKRVSNDIVILNYSCQIGANRPSINSRMAIGCEVKNK